MKNIKKNLTIIFVLAFLLSIVLVTNRISRETDSLAKTEKSNINKELKIPE